MWFSKNNTTLKLLGWNKWLKKNTWYRNGFVIEKIGFFKTKYILYHIAFEEIYVEDHFCNLIEDFDVTTNKLKCKLELQKRKLENALKEVRNSTNYYMARLSELAFAYRDTKNPMIKMAISYKYNQTIKQAKKDYPNFIVGAEDQIVDNHMLN